MASTPTRSHRRQPLLLPPPVHIRVGNRHREIVTGGGLCDPGRCLPESGPKGKPSHLSPGLIDIMSKHDLLGKPRAAVMNKSKVMPFGEEPVQQGRKWLMTKPNDQLEQGDRQADLHVHESQPFLLT